MGFENLLVDAANQLDSLIRQAWLTNNPEKKLSLVTEAALVSCATLKELVNDDDFYTAFRELADVRSRIKRLSERADRTDQEHMMLLAFRRVVADSDKSFEKFLKSEYQVLISGKMHEAAVANLLRQSRDALKSIRKGLIPIEDFISAVERLAHEACEASAAGVIGYFEAGKEEEVMGMLERIRNAVGGLAMIAINGAAATAAIPVPFFKTAFAAGSQLSIAIGTHIAFTNAPKKEQGHAA